MIVQCSLLIAQTVWFLFIFNFSVIIRATWRYVCKCMSQTVCCCTESLREFSIYLTPFSPFAHWNFFGFSFHRVQLHTTARLHKFRVMLSGWLLLFYFSPCPSLSLPSVRLYKLHISRFWNFLVHLSSADPRSLSLSLASLDLCGMIRSTSNVNDDRRFFSSVDVHIFVFLFRCCCCYFFFFHIFCGCLCFCCCCDGPPMNVYILTNIVRGIGHALHIILKCVYYNERQTNRILSDAGVL